MKTSQPGYYPGYHTLSQQQYWDATTRGVVLHRVNHVPPIRFFDPVQAELLECICDRMLPQDDRDAAHRIPIVPHIDERLFEDKGEGYRYESMPPEREAYQLGLTAIEEIAQHLHNLPFIALSIDQRDSILESLHDNHPPAAHHIWKRMPVHRFWLLLLQDCVTAYYSHPFAWDEIGYGGPAYPRAYMRLENGQPEPWEKHEVRHEWKPAGSGISEQFKPLAGMEEHRGGPQGGTH